jgi:hypothetical protein
LLTKIPSALFNLKVKILFCLISVVVKQTTFFFFQIKVSFIECFNSNR